MEKFINISEIWLKYSFKKPNFTSFLKIPQTRTCNSINYKFLNKSENSEAKEGKKLQFMSHMRNIGVVLLCSAETMWLEWTISYENYIHVQVHVYEQNDNAVFMKVWE